ncbi:hypothetical protein D6764_04130 [Candidatus Woesearchaeota archaeon]|nr:MAG: hypothetical protein D6764_04130 [Candidatus Woesearchaeota archaeon]
MDEKTISELRNRTIVGLAEEVEIIGEEESRKVIARIDSGATLSSIDINLASELKLGPVTRTKFVKSAQGSTTKPVVKASVRIGGRRIKASFTLSDRSHLTYPVLIGQNILKMDFLIDPKKPLPEKSGKEEGDDNHAVP